MPRYNLTEVAPPQPAGIACRYFLPSLDQTDRHRILVVSFTGEYPPGSLGNAHGAYIATCTLHGLHAFDAYAVILDFRELTYSWGNTLLQVFQDVGQFKDCGNDPGSPPFPVAVVTSEKCRDAFLTLVTPSGRKTPKWHFEKLDLAISYSIQAAREWLDF